jgi:hypothetical protein
MKIKLNKTQWEQIGKTAGWEIQAQSDEQEGKDFDWVYPSGAGVNTTPWKNYRNPGFRRLDPSIIIGKFKKTVEQVSTARNQEEAAGIIEEFIQKIKLKL